MKAVVSERVKALDFKIGAPQARRPGRRKPNIEILFTDKPQALLDLVGPEAERASRLSVCRRT